MALIQLTCLILATTLVKISEAQCYGRNGYCNNGVGGGGFSRAYLPVVLTDQFPPYREIPTRNPTSPTTDPCPATVPGESSTQTVLTNEDLKALLLLARVLESDKTACATKGIDVHRLLETLVTALVYTTTHTVETSMKRCNIPAQNDADSLGLLGQNGLVDKLLTAIVGGQSGHANGGFVNTSSVAQGSNSGRDLLDLSLGPDGLELNVGGKTSATGASGTSTTTVTTASSGAAASTTTNKFGNIIDIGGTQTYKNRDKGDVARNGGLLGNVLEPVRELLDEVVDGLGKTLDGVGETVEGLL